MRWVIELGSASIRSKGRKKLGIEMLINRYAAWFLRLPPQTTRSQISVLGTQKNYDLACLFTEYTLTTIRMVPRIDTDSMARPIDH